VESDLDQSQTKNYDSLNNRDLSPRGYLDSTDQIILSSINKPQIKLRAQQTATLKKGNTKSVYDNILDTDESLNNR
jgi:hypothetical protein